MTNYLHLLLKADFNFPFNGFGLSIRGDNAVHSADELAGEILAYFKKKQIKVLVMQMAESNSRLGGVQRSQVINSGRSDR